MDLRGRDKEAMEHRIRTALRHEQLRRLEERRPRTFMGVAAGIDIKATKAYVTEKADGELSKSLIRGWTAGAMWTADRVHRRGLRETPICPYCSDNQIEDEMHAIW